MKKLLRYSVACLSMASLQAMEMSKDQSNSSNQITSADTSQHVEELNMQMPWEREDSSKNYFSKVSKYEPAAIGELIPYIITVDHIPFKEKQDIDQQVANLTDEELELVLWVADEDRPAVNRKKALYKNFIKMIAKLNGLLKFCQQITILKDSDGYIHPKLFDALQNSFLADAKHLSMYHFKTCFAGVGNAAAQGDNFLEFIIKKIEEIKKIEPRLMCPTEEFQSLVKDDLESCRASLAVSQFELQLGVIMATAKAIPENKIEEYVSFFYENDNWQVLKNFTHLLNEHFQISIERSIACGLNHRIDPFIINSYLPTLQAYKNVKDFLNKHTVPTFVVILLLIAAQTGNKDLAALAIQKGAFKYLNDPKIFDVYSWRIMSKIKEYYPILEDLYRQRRAEIATCNSHAEEFLEYALQTALKNKQNEMCTFLKNSTVDSTYFKPKHIHPNFTIQQFKAVQQPENSSRASGYYAVINGLALYRYESNNQNTYDETILSKAGELDRLQSQISGMRSKVEWMRCSHGLLLLRDMVYDALLESIKGIKKMGDQGYSLEATALKELGGYALEEILQSLAVSIAYPLLKAKLTAETEDDVKNFAHHNTYGWQTELHFDSDSMRNSVKNIACDMLPKLNLSRSLSVDEFLSWFNFSPCSFKVEYKENQNKICGTTSFSGESKQYEYKYSERKPLSLPTANIQVAQPLLVPPYGIRKQIIENYIEKNGLSAVVSPECIESIARATNEWDKEMIEAMIESAIEAQSRKPEKIMHVGESPLIFDETNSMPVYWDNTTIKTDMDKHLYAQWKKHEADRLYCLDDQNRTDSSLPTDWLSFTELSYLVEKGTPIFYVSDSNLSSNNKELQKITDVLRNLKKALVFIESNNHWISCVISKHEKDKIHFAIADSKNCDRRYDKCILHIINYLTAYYKFREQ